MNNNTSFEEMNMSQISLYQLVKIYPPSALMNKHSGTIHPFFRLREDKGNVTFQLSFPTDMKQNDNQDDFLINSTLLRICAAPKP